MVTYVALHKTLYETTLNVTARALVSGSTNFNNYFNN